MSSADDSSTSPPRHKWTINPFAQLMRIPEVSVQNGSARLEFVIEEIHLRPGGIIHGGVYATLLDTVAGYAAHSVAPKDAEVVTMQLNLSMTGTARLGQTIIVTAQAVHAGRKTTVVNGEIRLSTGKLLVTGSGTFFFIEGKIGG